MKDGILAVLSLPLIGAVLWGVVALLEAAEDMAWIFRAELGGRPRDGGGDAEHPGAADPRLSEPIAPVGVGSLTDHNGQHDSED